VVVRVHRTHRCALGFPFLLPTFWFGPRKQSLAPCPSPLTAGKRAVKRGIDDAVRGLEWLKRAKHSGLNPAYFDEKLTLFETHRTLLNSYFCNNVEGIELQDEVRFAKRNREHEKRMLDEVQVYQDVKVVEENRRIEGRAPKVRFLSFEEQQAWERQYPKPPVDVRKEPQHRKGEQG